MSKPTIPDQMDASAKVFRETAAKPGTEPEVARVLLKVAEDYERCAAYIRNLEDKLARFQLQSIRNKTPLAELRRSKRNVGPPPSEPDAA
jgi:hypothetical protein